MKEDKWRGHNIVRKNATFFYEDNLAPVHENKERNCNHCKLKNTKEGHDACLGTLPNVMNACCGHGYEDLAYIQLLDGSIIQGKEAMKKQAELKEKI